MNLYHYEFEPQEIECCCAKCEKLNAIETRGFMLIEDEKEKKEKDAREIIQSKDITTLHKKVMKLIDDVEIQGQQIRQVKKQIEEFGKKKFSDLMN